MAFRSIRSKILLCFIIIIFLSLSFLFVSTPKLNKLQESSSTIMSLHEQFKFLSHQIELVEQLEIEIELYILLKSPDYKRLLLSVVSEMRNDVTSLLPQHFEAESIESIWSAFLETEKSIFALITSVESAESAYLQNLRIHEAYLTAHALSSSIDSISRAKEAVLTTHIQKQNDLTTSIFRDFLLLELLTILFGIILSFILAKKITKPLQELDKSASQIGHGNLDTQITVQSHDEIGNLAKSFNTMITNLKNYQKKLLLSEKKRGTELEQEVRRKTKALSKNVEELEHTKKAILNMMEDLDSTNKELKKLDKAKSEFLNIVSHELKTPLTAIIAYLDILESSIGKPTENEAKSLDAIKRNSRNLNRLIGNILEIARMESGKFELIYQETDMGKLVEDTTKDISSLSDQKGIKIITKVADMPPVRVDSQRIGEVITNLVGNAIKFTTKGSITVQAKKNGNKIEFEITDTGVGIPKKHLRKLFTKFYQVDASISRKYGGTGLGLTITKKIIEAHGGNITVSSTVGKGTTFSFYITVNNKKEAKH